MERAGHKQGGQSVCKTTKELVHASALSSPGDRIKLPDTACRRLLFSHLISLSRHAETSQQRCPSRIRNAMG